MPDVNDTEQIPESGTSRRTLLKNAAKVGAVGFATPTIISLTAPSASASPPPGSCSASIHVKAGQTVTFSNNYVAGCNQLQLSFSFNGTSTTLVNKTDGFCQRENGNPYSFVAPVDGTITVELYDATCNNHFPASGAHGTVTCLSPNVTCFTIDDSGGFCESPPSDPRTSPCGGGNSGTTVTVS